MNFLNRGSAERDKISDYRGVGFAEMLSPFDYPTSSTFLSKNFDKDEFIACKPKVFNKSRGTDNGSDHRHLFHIVYQR